MAPGVDSSSNRNEYQEYFLGGKGGWCIGLTTLPPTCAVCLEIWEPQPPGTLKACNGIALPLPLPLFQFIFTLHNLSALFLIQFCFLSILNCLFQVAQRCLPFLHNCIKELEILEISAPAGAVACWVFLCCLEVLHTCEHFNDSGQVEAYSLYTASLWAYARDKVG